MTPALKAMVEAMGAEFERQASHGLTYAEFDPSGRGEPTLTVGEDGGLFDLEKVARAGLEAIDQPPLDHPVWRDHDPAAPEAFHAFVRAMLGDGPRAEVMGDRWAPIDGVLRERPGSPRDYSHMVESEPDAFGNVTRTVHQGPKKERS